MPRPRNLLLCFDAFGTLFSIKHPIERQYADVACRQFGIAGFTDGQLRVSFDAAFKAASRQHPNYGHTSGMGATAWWTGVIESTFAPFVAKVPRGLAPSLIERFASRKAYTKAPQLLQLLRRLHAHTRYEQVVVGVITNSDDRVPDILSSMGLRVGALRYPAQQAQNKASADASGRPSLATGVADIDFHCMSYDVGVEKPDPRIFQAALELLPVAVAERQSRLHAHGTGHDSKSLAFDPDDWDRMYVGDEWDKDVVGAQAAGWFPVLLDEGDGAGYHAHPIAERRDIQSLSELSPQPVSELAEQFPVVRTSSLAYLLAWLRA